MTYLKAEEDLSAEDLSHLYLIITCSLQIAQSRPYAPIDSLFHSRIVGLIRGWLRVLNDQRNGPGSAGRTPPDCTSEYGTRRSIPNR